MDPTPNPQTRRQVLDTSAADLPWELAGQVADACEPVGQVTAAYVARMRETLGADGPSHEILAVALELASPPANHPEPRAIEAITAVLDGLPQIKRVSVLHDAALPVWRDRAIRVFTRA